jgi:hypothetical protein
MFYLRQILTGLENNLKLPVRDLYMQITVILFDGRSILTAQISRYFSLLY